VTGIRRERFGDFSVLRREATAEGGVTVHFAHATGFNAETYRLLLASLHPALDVRAMDARGHGMTKARAVVKELRSWSPYRADLRTFVETLPQPVVLAGHSMGATVSAELAASRPDLVQGLVLVDPVVIAPKYVPLAALTRTIGLSHRLIPVSQAAAQRRSEFPSKRDTVENYVGKGAFRTWPREWIEAYVEGGTVPTDAGTVRLSCDPAWESRTFAKASVNPLRAVAKLRCPITLLTYDRAEPPFSRAACDAFMRAKPDTRLVVLDGASHFIPMERPKLVRDEIERMAARVRSELG
jgi:pimeloyl-ACP methyl ester carboxylesterase